MTEKPKVLVVDDEEVFLDIMVDKLSKEGFDVLTAKDGQEGLDVALKEHPKVILLDVLMPKMHGWDMYNKLRQDQWGNKVPVIILTNVANASKQEEGQKTGQFDYCVKTDYNLVDIVKKIKDKAGV